MLITLSKTNIDYCRKNIDRLDNKDILRKFISTYCTLASNIRHGCGVIFDNFDWHAFDKRFSDEYLDNIDKTSLIERVNRFNELIELGKKANKAYDEMCEKASSVTIEGIVADDRSNTCIYLELPTGNAYRVFADRLNMGVQKFVRPNVGKKARVHGFLSFCENASYYGGITVAKSIELID